MNRIRLWKKLVISYFIISMSLQSWSFPPQIVLSEGNGSPVRMTVLPGQSVTQLPNGKWLILGGIDNSVPVLSASIGNPSKGGFTPLKAKPMFARAWHTATVLPDGMVLIFGGIGADNRVVAQAELFDPTLLSFRPVKIGLQPRAYHSAVVLTDGRLIVVGGVDKSGRAVRMLEGWDSKKQVAHVLNSELSTGRHSDHGTLLADGTVVFWGGAGDDGSELTYGELYDGELDRLSVSTPTEISGPDLNVPLLEGSYPKNGASGVPTDTIISLRFSKLLRAETLTPKTVTLATSESRVQALVIPAEGGRLAFVKPAGNLAPGTSYTVTADGASDAFGLLLASKHISFTTTPLPPSTTSNSGGSSDLTAQGLSPLQAAPGVTAIAGQALKLDGTALANVTFKVDDRSVRTDRTGRFLLTNVSAGHHAMEIDGRTASQVGHVYGVFEVGVDLEDGKTTVLPYKVWMTELDVAHTVHVQFPTTQEVIITNPNLPGLEFHIPPNTVITDIDGKVAREISITAIPISQPPFPLPAVQVPVYFTIQPGGGYIQVNNKDGQKGGTLIYPNTYHQAPGTRINFWNYDPDTTRGWYVYGLGTVSPNGQSIVPDPGVVLYQLTGAMVASGSSGAPYGPAFGAGVNSGGGDPVDLSTGLFIYHKTDFYIPDVIPIALTRSYRPGDTTSRAFGIGTTHPYDMYISGNLSDFSYVELVMPDGSRVRFDRISGNFWNTSTLQCVSAPGEFYGALFTNSNGWTITLRNGTVLNFLQPGGSGAMKYQDVGLRSITDRNGNTLQIVRDSNNYITGINSPNGRWIQFTNDSSHRIMTATDNIGRTVQYMYDSNGRLQQVTDANGGVWTYGYDPVHTDQMTSITDARRIQYLQNSYDSNGRVTKQVLADPADIYQFSYVTDSGNNVTQTTVTDPNGNIRQVTFPAPPYYPDGYFRSGGYMSSDIHGLARPEQETTTYQRSPGSNLLTSVTDSLNRTTVLTYDLQGNITGVTKLSGTQSAASTYYTYDSTFSRLTSTTDPLSHSTTFAYDTKGNIISITDAIGDTINVTNDSEGRPASVTAPTGNAWGFGYSGGDLTSVNDSLGDSAKIVTDGVGRVIAVTNPEGQTTQFLYNALDRITAQLDPRGGRTSLSYDPNGNLTSLADASNATTPTIYNYDIMDRLQTRTDPLGGVETFAYDHNGNLTCLTDRRGVNSVFVYDSIDRLTLASYGTAVCNNGSSSNTVAYSYDSGDRITNVTDSISGVITPMFDGFDRLTSETSSLGAVSYQYDMAGRKTAMIVAGQPIINYSYDNADRLTTMTQGSTVIGFGYDSSGRRTTLSLPNGISAQYVYDNASRLSTIKYQSNSNAINDLQYQYDAGGRVVQVSGALARVSLPSAVTLASYDSANRLTAWGGVSPQYDANGNMTNDGINTFVWDARNHLSSISGTVVAAFQYDSFGRRVNKSVGGVSTSYLYDGPTIVQEISGTVPVANLLTGSTDEIFLRTDNTVTGFLSDVLGSTVALTDITGATTTQYTYEPYGKATVTGSVSTNTVQYTGRENDGTGNYFYRSRYYNPVFQRFVSQDPIGFRGGSANLYAYALSSPTNFTDPNGKAVGELALEGAEIGSIFGPEGTLAGGAVGALGDLAQALALLKVAQSLSQSGSTTVPDATTGNPDPNGRQSHDPKNRKPCYDEKDVDDAKKQFPRKANLPPEAHHITPQYLGGDPAGTTVLLPAAYHQLITNAFRNQWPYASEDIPTDDELREIMEEVYSQYPYKKCE